MDATTLNTNIRVIAAQVMKDKTVLDNCKRDALALSKELSALCIAGTFKNPENASSKDQIVKMMPPSSDDIVDHMSFAVRCVKYLAKNPDVLDAATFLPDSAPLPTEETDTVFKYTSVFNQHTSDSAIDTRPSVRFAESSSKPKKRAKKTPMQVFLTGSR